MPLSPKSVKIKCELGQEKTLPQGVRYFKEIKKGQIPLFLGLGPNAEKIQKHFSFAKIFVLEHPSLQLPNTGDKIQYITPGHLTPDFLELANIFIYLPEIKYFPSFFGPILARIKTLHFPSLPRSQDSIWLLASKKGLLTLELTWAFQEVGLKVRLIEEEDEPNLLALLTQERPKLALSLNAWGLDSWGKIQFLLQERKIPLLCWLLDNPFNVLSKFRGHFFKNLYFLLTDPFFLPWLQKKGLENLFFLPLASCPQIFAHSTPLKEYQSQLLFISRSTFPGYHQYFAGLSLDQEIIKAGKEELARKKRPDLSWLSQKREITLSQARYLNYQIHHLNLLYRQSMLQHIGQKQELKIVGDSNWKRYVDIPLLPPVDYYTQLKNVYKSASFVLNLTNFLLPFSLNQRHFDVWLSDSFLLTDYTPGLKIFPQEIIDHFSFNTPSELDKKINILEKDSRLKNDIKNFCKQEILQKHTYKHRVAHILNLVELFS